jgi:hypothetical protein
MGTLKINLKHQGKQPARLQFWRLEAYVFSQLGTQPLHGLSLAKRRLAQKLKHIIAGASNELRSKIRRAA